MRLTAPVQMYRLPRGRLVVGVTITASDLRSGFNSRETGIHLMRGYKGGDPRSWTSYSKVEGSLRRWGGLRSIMIVPNRFPPRIARKL